MKNNLSISKYTHALIRAACCCLMVGALTSCHSYPGKPMSTRFEESVNFVDKTWNTLVAIPDSNPPLWIAASKSDGLRIITSKGVSVFSKTGTYELLDHRQEHNTHWILTLNQQTNAPELLQLEQQSNWVQTNMKTLKNPDFQIDSLCLFLAGNNDLYAFFLDGYGGGEQRWLVEGDTQHIVDRQIKTLNVPPESETCRVHDQTRSLFIGEENFGVWRYPAQPDTPWHRQLVFNAKANDQSITQLATTGQALYILTDTRLHTFIPEPDHWKIAASQRHRLSAESVAINQQNFIAAVLDKNGANIYFVHLPESAPIKAPLPTYARVTAQMETSPMPRKGDTADDPAIWVHPRDTSKSLVLATDKKWGLRVYDLAGREIQSIASGHINNIDTRQAVQLNGETLDIAAASNRSNNAIELYTIHTNTTNNWAQVKSVATLPTGLKEVYGICLYHPSADSLYAFINDKDGRVRQYQIKKQNKAFYLHKTGEFSFNSQPEGCVADDETGNIFFGEEDTGLWLINAKQNAGLRLIEPVGKRLVADVEGMALIKNALGHYLVVSSQGDSSYAVFNAYAPFEYRGSFTIGFKVDGAIDGVSETDGLDLTGVTLSDDYPGGMLVVQDGHNVMPEQPQNFKYISWKDVLTKLGIL